MCIIIIIDFCKVDMKIMYYELIKMLITIAVLIFFNTVLYDIFLHHQHY